MGKGLLVASACEVVCETLSVSNDAEGGSALSVIITRQVDLGYKMKLPKQASVNDFPLSATVPVQVSAQTSLNGDLEV